LVRSNWKPNGFPARQSNFESKWRRMVVNGRLRAFHPHMAHWLKVLMVALLLFLAAAVPLAMQRAAAPLRWGALEGTLTDEDGPVAGATVEAQHSGSGAMTRAVTDQRGFYRLSDLQRGWYSMWIVSARHNSVSVPRIFVEEGATTRKDVQMGLMSRSTESAQAP
jgi:hypothetical protein